MKVHNKRKRRATGPPPDPRSRSGSPALAGQKAYCQGVWLRWQEANRAVVEIEEKGLPTSVRCAGR